MGACQFYGASALCSLLLQWFSFVPFLAFCMAHGSFCGGGFKIRFGSSVGVIQAFMSPIGSLGDFRYIRDSGHFVFFVAFCSISISLRCIADSPIGIFDHPVGRQPADMAFGPEDVPVIAAPDFGGQLVDGHAPGYVIEIGPIRVFRDELLRLFHE
jgi:hypothetical protein